ncbi:MAG: Crp/Fnr family transcriptional regulator [Saprospiraceae bacterium]|nr:Crp/Fnr family transcriptional regulator [Saprospiraceae bacterium]
MENPSLRNKITNDNKSIKDAVVSIKSLSAQQFEHIDTFITVKKVKKGETLLRKGELTNKSYFVKKGCLRSYAIDDKGKEHVFMFAPEGWIVSDMSTQLTDMPSDLFIDALEDCEVEVFDRRLFDFIETIFPRVNTLTNEKMIKRVAVLQKRIIMLMSATAWERYQNFIETYPSIVQRVPQRMIASYLGITPEALSKLRGDNTKTKTKIS